MRFTRRSLLAAPALCAAPAMAADADYAGWTRVRGDGTLPLHVGIETGEGVQALGEWLGGRPAVLALWASWCTPCLVEKPSQAAMARRLEAHGARARILALQAFDDVDRRQGCELLMRLGAGNLQNGFATREAERAFTALLGESTVDASRPVMPWHLLVDSNGRELARAVGLMRGTNGRYTYFEDEATFRFLSQLA